MSAPDFATYDGDPCACIQCAEEEATMFYKNELVCLSCGLSLELNVKDARIAELERQLAEAREVKPLEWRPWLLGSSQAKSIFGTYHTWPGYWRAPEAIGGTAADDPEAAAEADYTARVLSALKEPKP